MQAVNKYIKSTKREEQYCPTPVSLPISKNPLILEGFNWVQAIEKAWFIKQFEAIYLITLKGRPFSDYSVLSKLEKIHRVKFLEKYEYRNSCREFICYTSDFKLSYKDVKNKPLRTNFIDVLNDGTADVEIVEQKVIYVNRLWFRHFQILSNFLTVAELHESQDTPGLKKALFKSFQDCYI